MTQSQMDLLLFVVVCMLGIAAWASNRRFKKSLTFSNARIEVTLNGKPLQSIKTINYSSEHELSVPKEVYEKILDDLIAKHGGERAALFKVAENCNAALDRVEDLKREVVVLREQRGDLDCFLVAANAKRKQFERSYKKKRLKVQQLHGELCEVDKRFAALRTNYDEVVTAILENKPIEVLLPERIARPVRA